MKTFQILLFSFFISSLMTAQNEDHFEYKNAFKISPIEFGSAEFQVAYEKYFGERASSILLSPSIILKDNHEESKSGLQFMAQYKIFFSHLRRDEGKAILGLHNISFYGGLYTLYLDYEEDYFHNYYDPELNMSFTKEYHKDISSFEGGALFGIQFDITKRILLDLYAGGGIRNTNLDDNREFDENEPNYYYYDVFDPEYKGVKPKLGLQLGITF